MQKHEKNSLFYGDNLDVLRRYVKDETVDLVYLDPPFKSDQDYNILFAEKDGTKSTSQIQAFKDTWEWDETAAASYEEVVEKGGKPAEAMRAFRTFLPGTGRRGSDMLAYLSMMAPRLLELHRVLRDRGSIYLHCDPTASHYLKLLMDAIFEPTGFQNEIIWSFRRWPSPSNHYQRMHNVLLFYGKGRKGPSTFNVEYEDNSPSYTKRFKGKTQVLDPVSRSRKITSEEESKGLPRRDVWELSIIAGSSNERLGYPTQKPEALLERIIRASTNEGDIVLDPFCGCGTTVAVAQRLGRRWVGIDLTHLAINLIRYRLINTYGDEVVNGFDVIGEPTSVQGAKQLASEDPYQFQWWALGLVGARPANQKKGADQGVDGRIYFHDESRGGKTKQIIFEVKAGHVTSHMVRSLRGVIDREEAEIGVLISMQSATPDMRQEAANAGFYQSSWGNHPRLQLITVGELLDGKRVDMPPIRQTNRTFKKAVRHVEQGPDSGNLFEQDWSPPPFVEPPE